jgi:hypothetical protein
LTREVGNHDDSELARALPVDDEDAAVVLYTTDPVVKADLGERWVVESGTWRWDNC